MLIKEYRICMPLTVEEVSSHSCTEQPRLQQKQRLRASRRGLQVSCSIFRIKKLRRWRATRFLFFLFFLRQLKRTAALPQLRCDRAVGLLLLLLFSTAPSLRVPSKLCRRDCVHAAGMETKKKKKRCYTVSVHIAHGCHASHQVNNHVSYHLIHRFSFHAKTFLQRLHYVLLMQLLHDIRRQAWQPSEMLKSRFNACLRSSLTRRLSSLTHLEVGFVGYDEGA